MATHSITNVALVVAATEGRASSGSKRNVAEGRQVVAAAIIGEQTRETEVTKEDITQAVSHLKEYVQHMKRDIDFSVDDQTGRFIVKVYDSETKELIRQIPSEEMLAISRHLADSLNEDEEARKGFLIELNA